MAQLWFIDILRMDDPLFVVHLIMGYTFDLANNYGPGQQQRILEDFENGFTGVTRWLISSKAGYLMAAMVNGVHGNI
jgi:hypothetical protein